MKQKKSIIIILVLGLTTFLSCAPKEQDRSEGLRKDIMGEWRNVYLKVTTNVLGSVDSARVTECDSTNWEKMLGIKPIRTFFLPDGTYRSEYYNLKDSLFMTNTGVWKISRDSLTMEQLQPKAAAYKVRTSVTNGLAEFDGVIDFDNDGQADDHYQGKQRKQ